MTIADVLRHEGGMPVFSQQMLIEDCYPENIKNNGVGKNFPSKLMKFDSDFSLICEGGGGQSAILS